MNDIKFYNPTINRQLNFDDLVKEIICYIKEKPSADYRITIGTDSPGITNPQFVTAITVLRVGNGGRYFWTRSKKIYCPTLQERIYKEAMQSITMTQELRSHLKDSLGEDFFWPARRPVRQSLGVDGSLGAGEDDKITIHIDVGRNGPTKDLVEGVMGMVKGYGFAAVIKPDAFCACTVADKHT